MILIYLLVVAQFRSYLVPLIIMAPIPLTLIGVMPGHALLGPQFTATSMIGMIALAGIIVRCAASCWWTLSSSRGAGMPFERAVIESGAGTGQTHHADGAGGVIGTLFILDDPIFNGLAISLIFQDPGLHLAHPGGDTLALLCPALPTLMTGVTNKGRNDVLFSPTFVTGSRWRKGGAMKGWLWWTGAPGWRWPSLAWWLRRWRRAVPLVSVDRGEVRVTVVLYRAGTIKVVPAGRAQPCQLAAWWSGSPSGRGQGWRKGRPAADPLERDIRADLTPCRAQQASARPARGVAAGGPTGGGRPAAGHPARQEPHLPHPGRAGLGTWPIPAAISAGHPASRSGSTRRRLPRWRPAWPRGDACWRRLPAWWPRSTAS